MIFSVAQGVAESTLGLMATGAGGTAAVVGAPTIVVSAVGVGVAALSFTPSAIIQADDYYPFGGSFSTNYKRENSLKNKRLYNGGSELMDDLGMDVYLTDYRTYDPWGRLGWWEIDPKVDEFYDESPYNFSHNNPIRYNDPKGDCPECGELYRAAANAIESNYGDTYAGQFVAGALGAVAGYLNPGEGVVNNLVQQYNEGGIANVLYQNGTPQGIGGQLVDQTKGIVDLGKRAANGDGKAAGELSVHVGVAVASGLEGRGNTKSGPSEAYNRTKHYGKTPTQADRNALGAKKGQDVDHTNPLVKHYYEGDGNGKAGHKMTEKERKTFAKDRSNMTVKPSGTNRSEGGKLSQYSKDMKKKYGLD